MIFARLVLVFAISSLAPIPPAQALVGPTVDASAYGAHAIMVLTRGQGRAGFCSGAVVARNIVLTAAHCVGAPSATRVHFRDADGAPVLLSVKRIARNPRYRADAVKTRMKSIDLALVETDEPLPPAFAPVALGDGPQETGALVDVAGFGVAREGDAASSGTLRGARLSLRAPLSNVLLWLDSNNGAGACTGDSGAPVFANGAVVGIVAYAQAPHGRGCGGLTQAVRVAPAKAWIEETIGAWR